ncbi:hypothetical protein F3Y22_tig00111099pilonHSYRG00251 [Hibiscus syriacus]|uniref:DNA replication factor Cdt1 C-terminal domain-containing protein n=1 Tax=Hibiscus syriacus TaxID=106335 RepID=A0A6A2Z2S4_HIBSY|nr:hypothetical protein F3Y22_tig00111099pilonHSYRG00251 [Hibiscus syriacus]
MNRETQSVTPMVNLFPSIVCTACVKPATFFGILGVEHIHGLFHQIFWNPMVNNLEKSILFAGFQDLLNDIGSILTEIDYWDGFGSGNNEVPGVVSGGNMVVKFQRKISRSLLTARSKIYNGTSSKGRSLCHLMSRQRSLTSGEVSLQSSKFQLELCASISVDSDNTNSSPTQTPNEFLSKATVSEPSSKLCLPVLPIKEINPLETEDRSPTKSSCNQSTPAKLASTPARLMIVTPTLQPQKRCYMSPDEVRRPLRTRSLKLEEEKVTFCIQEERKRGARSSNLAAKRLQQSIACLPKFFNMIHYLFQSIKRSVIAKEELMHKIITGHCDTADRGEIEEQLKLLLELAPEWISENTASSGDLLVWCFQFWVEGLKPYTKDTGTKGLEYGADLTKIRGMRQRELLEFRTPQHPSLGTNNWGGASPLLARDIPKESLEQRYSRLYFVRNRDEIFLTHGDVFQSQAAKHEQAPTPSRRSRGFLLKLMFPQKETVTLGTNSNRRRWFPRWDPKNRWPQGVVLVKFKMVIGEWHKDHHMHSTRC